MNVEALVVCQFDACKMVYRNPVTLPCGYSLCLEHLEKFDETFNCFFCKQVHTQPRDGFFTSNTISSLIEYYFEMDPVRKEIKSSFDKLNQIIYEHQKLAPEGYIFDYIRKIINKVDLHREESIKYINEKSDEIINKLIEKEQICKSNASKFEKVNLEELKTADLLIWKDSLRKTDLKQQELDVLLSNIKEKLTFAQNETDKYKNDLLMNESIYFDKYEKNDSFGKISFYSSKSKILSKDCGKLIKILNQKTELIKSIQVDEKSKRLITASRNNKIKIWDLETGECLKTLNTDAKVLLIISNNKFISASSDRTLKIWDLNSYECLNVLPNETQILTLCLISDNKIASGCINGRISIWNLDTLTKIKTFIAHNCLVRYLLMADETKLISCSSHKDNKIKIWNLETFECIKVLRGHSNYIFNLDLTSDGYLFSCSTDKTVKSWRLETGELLKSIQFEHPVYYVKTLNEDLIAVALENGDIQIYNFNKEEIVKTILAHSFPVLCLNLLKNGDLLCESAQGEMKLFKMLE